MIAFTNPANNYTTTGTTPFTWLWCLLFGPLFFVYKGVWSHAVISIVAAFITFGISWLIYPFFASWAIKHHFQTKGWVAA